jgi:hypothetical protein
MAPARHGEPLQCTLPYFFNIHSPFVTHVDILIFLVCSRLDVTILTGIMCHKFRIKILLG